MNAPAAGSPPLSVWVISLLAAAVVVTLVGNLQPLGLLPPNADDFRILNLARLPHVRDSTLHVVALGSSKTFFAVEFDQQFAKRLKISDKKVAFTRISTSSPTITDVDGALDALVQEPPDILLLESDLLLVDRHYDRHSGWHAWLDRIRSNFRLLGSIALDTPFMSDRQNYGEISWRSNIECLATKSPDRLKAYALEARRWSASNAAGRGDYLVFLRALRLAGTRVVLLELPRSPSAELVAPTLLKQRMARVRASLIAQEGYLDWAPGAMAEALYCDQGHLNQNGREVYSDWLAKQLMSLLVRADA